MEIPAQKFTTTDDTLQVYRERDLGSTAIARVGKGVGLYLARAAIRRSVTQCVGPFPRWRRR